MKTVWEIIYEQRWVKKINVVIPSITTQKNWNLRKLWIKNLESIKWRDNAKKRITLQLKWNNLVANRNNTSRTFEFKREERLISIAPKHAHSQSHILSSSRHVASTGSFYSLSLSLFLSVSLSLSLSLHPSLSIIAPGKSSLQHPESTQI